MDLLIFGVHAAFWTAFGVTRALVSRSAPSGPSAAANSEQKTARFSRGLLAFHMVAFGVMYAGTFRAVLPGRVPELFPFQRGVGAAVIAFGAFMMCWSLVFFRSWRFRAQLDAGHQLATDGPFAWVRHPIYLGLTLLALGTATWVPTPITAVAAVLMALGSDLRGRAEEKLLMDAFGDQYRAYTQRTRRFLPGLY